MPLLTSPEERKRARVQNFKRLYLVRVRLLLLIKDKNENVEEIMFIKDLKCRSLPSGKGDGGLGCLIMLKKYK
jgi:hypothetical protein